MGRTVESPGDILLRLRLPAGSDLLRIVANASRGICSDLSLDCGPNGITAQVMNSTHVALLVVKMEPTNFTEYSCARPVTLGVDADWFSQALGAGRPDDSLELVVASDLDHITLNFSGSEKGCGTDTTLELKLRDLDCEVLGIPVQAPRAEAWIPTKDLLQLCQALSEFGSRGVQVNICADEAGFSFTVVDELVQARYLLRNAGAIAITVDETCSGAFSLCHLAAFSQALGPGLVRLGFAATGEPLCVEYNRFSGGRLQLFLVPRIA